MSGCHPTHVSRRRASAFTLVELLVVMAIISILVALVVPAVKNITASTDLNVSAGIIVDTLELGRQTAISTDRPVEARFYEIPRPDNAAMNFRAIGIYTSGEGNSVLIGKLLTLRSNIVMSNTDTFGTLLSKLPAGQDTLPSVAPGGTQKFNYRFFMFLPDGTVNIPLNAPTSGNDTWHVTLYDQTKPPASNKPPSNYITIQLLPESGRTRVFQP